MSRTAEHVTVVMPLDALKSFRERLRDLEVAHETTVERLSEVTKRAEDLEYQVEALQDRVLELEFPSEW